MKDLSEQLKTKKTELEQLIAKGEQDRDSNHAEILKMRVTLTRMKEKFKVSERPLHEYTSSLGRFQIPSPPSYVLQKQAILCRAMHREGLQSKALDRIEQECTEIIRSSRKTIQDLREECASMELFLLKQVVILDDERSYLEQNNGCILKQQSEELKDLGKTPTTLSKKTLNLNDHIEEEKSEALTIKKPRHFRSSSFSKSLEKLSNFITYQCDSITTGTLKGTPIFSRKTIHTPPVA